MKASFFKTRNEYPLHVKFKFDHHQDFQLEAINAIADLFAGQPRAGDLAFSLSGAVSGGLGTMGQTELGFGNRLLLDDEAVFENLLAVQRRNGLLRTGEPRQMGKNFTVEMETGTGKTYVYLRTMFELNHRYGFKKFIVEFVRFSNGIRQAERLPRQPAKILRKRRSVHPV
ncbi:MAG: hypothetical protein EPO28_05215 [Saprospiraceae bacterium]|nr:MAG: hypothetical protein EPO28_05215 [Saprospiraceae bacterium]